MGFFRSMSKYRKRINVSLLIFLGFFLYANRVIIMGSSLLDMEIRVQKDFATTSRLITSHSAGYFVGAMIATFLDKYLNDFVAMGLGTSIAGIAIIAIPFLYNFYAIVLASFLNGISNSMYDLKSHIALTNVWGPERVGNSIQIHHIFYGLGCLFCPAFVRLFLLPIPNELDDYEAYTKMYKPEDVQLMVPFFSFGAPSFLIGFSFLYYFYHNPYSDEEGKNSEVKNTRKSIEDGNCSDIIEKPSRTHSKWKVYLAVLWVAAIAHLTFALANMICSYIQAFGVKSSLHMDKKTAALVATVFWTSYISARALFVGLTMVLSERLVVTVCHLMMIAGIIISFWFLTASPICLWMTAVLLGGGNSPLFPVAYSLLAKHFPLIGQHTSLIFLSGIFGESLNTALAGTLIDQDPMMFIYHIGGVSLLLALLSFTLPFVCRKMFGMVDQIEYDIELEGRSRIGSIMVPSIGRANSVTHAVD